MIYRIEVQGESFTGDKDQSIDASGETIRRQISEFARDPGPIQTRRIFLIDSDADEKPMQRVADELLADPIAESAQVVTTVANSAGSTIEVHLKPGVMDPVAASTEMAIRDMGIHVTQVRTGRSYLFQHAIDRDRLQQIAARVLANGVIESVHFEPYLPVSFEIGHLHRFQLQHVALRHLSDEQLSQLSREGHLFLSLAEMKAIQSYCREQGREPTDVELETLAQTWSEHCVHKTLKSAVDVEVRNASGKVVETRRYGNLIKETIFASTKRLMDGGSRSQIAGGADVGLPFAGTEDFCLSVFSDNAGVIAFDETDAVCFKVETHNHPSAIEPYGGSATGVGGVIRDILGTGLGAQPVANTDVFCVASHDFGGPLPRGVIHPKRILQQVVAGVRDYGNRMGIPTVNGAVYFDDRYLGNPLVFCGCVGLIPRNRIHKQAHPGDAVVLVGGRTGRDGIHGATFSSAELTDTHADEFSHAVQIGNAITEKKVADVILAARDRGLFTAITDCGAGGLSSAVGEMGEKIGADISLEKVPLKYSGLRHDEIWISEAQERMVLSAPKEKLEELLALAAEEDVEATVIGHFGTATRELILRYHDTEVARLSVDFLHNGIPMPTRRAVVETLPTNAATDRGAFSHGLETRDTKTRLLATLAHPNVASKHWIIRQYDHEVQGGSVIKPLTGPLQIGPSDAAVLRPKLGSYRGVVLGCGLSPQISDPYEMTLAAIDEAVRNVVAVGADLSRVAILDNFCWPSVDDEKTMGTLVRACEACRDAALAYGIPFISGKDSLHNQFTNQETGEVIRIPRTLLISAIGVIDDVRQCITMDLKKPGNRIAIVSAAGADLAGRVNTHRALSTAIRRGLIASCHDSSDGGIATAAAEMCIASGFGISLKLKEDSPPFRETCATYMIEFDPAQCGKLTDLLGIEFDDCGSVTADQRLALAVADKTAEASIAEMTRAWRGTLDW
jgi:phosphoribosylformylglycinamidine synthase II